jgi:FtsP/CotA-like multicopper oxidase with cupredoxin domain
VISGVAITRRKALLIGSQMAAGAALSCRLPGRPITSPTLPRFGRVFQVPPVLRAVRSDTTTDYFELTQRVGALDILPGARSEIWGFDGLTPGPTIVARRGRRVVVQHTNRLSVPTVVHLHGGVTPPESDGFPTDVIAPGTSRTYTYPNDQPAATLWYHDHAMHQTGRNIYMGLAGLYLIRDGEEEALGLPSGEYDVPLLIQERSLQRDGQLRYDRDRNLGALGDIVLVNGVPWPRMDVCARKYRFRVVNGTNASVFQLALSTGRPLMQIATDGGLLGSPAEQESIPLAMSERVEFVIDFSQYAIGSRVVLRNLNGQAATTEIMCFDVVCAGRDPSIVPDRLVAFERIPTGAAVRTREFTFNGGPASFPPETRWLINGLHFDPNRAIATPHLGDIEIWHIANRRRFGLLGMLHPVHVHLIRFQIVSRNGGPPGVHETGWKDTVAVPPGENVSNIARFEGYRGRYLIHCHNLEHEDHDMMARYDVV